MALDTNIVIAYFAGEQLIVDLLTAWRKEGQALFLATVVETEVLSFPVWTVSEREIAEKFLEENFTSMSFDRMTARIAAKLRAKTKIKFPDAAIAATALITHTPLVTRNVRDFQKIAELQVVLV